MRPRPNILLISTDQQRFDTVAALGNPIMQTPNMDRLVTEGVAFTQATTATPVCMAARWSMHTGQWTSTHRCYSNHHPGVRPQNSIPGMLRDHGYRIGLSGKNHTFLRPDEFDFWDEDPQPEDCSPWQERQVWMVTVARTTYPRLAEEPVPGGAMADPERAKTDAALHFMESCGDEPFFLWLSYHHPHTPYMAPEPYFSMYHDMPIPEPVVEPHGLKAARKPFRQQFHQRNNDAILPFTREQVMLMRRVYYGMISQVDAEVGRILCFLDERGLAANTLVVFTSDHGDYMGDHGLLTKSPALYDCLVRVPLIMRWPPLIDANRRDTSFASHVDLMPTFAAAVGIACPVQAQGINLLPFLKTSAAPREIRPAAYSEYGVPGRPYSETLLVQEDLQNKRFANPGNDRIPWEGNPVSLAGRIRMIRTREWKYVEDLGGTGELYDLVHDPYELENLWNQARHRVVQTEIEARMDHWKHHLNIEEEIVQRDTAAPR